VSSRCVKRDECGRQHRGLRPDRYLPGSCSRRPTRTQQLPGTCTSHAGPSTTCRHHTGRHTGRNTGGHDHPRDSATLQDPRKSPELAARGQPAPNNSPQLALRLEKPMIHGDCPLPTQRRRVYDVGQRASDGMLRWLPRRQVGPTWLRRPSSRVWEGCKETTSERGGTAR
jgi:hypothetical protein